jgi:hypothetical protein
MAMASVAAVAVGRKWWRRHRSLDDGHGLRAGGSDTAAYKWGPHGLIQFYVFPKQLKHVNSKKMPSIARKNLKFCMRIEWSILNKIFNCSDF